MRRIVRARIPTLIAQITSLRRNVIGDAHGLIQDSRGGEIPIARTASNPLSFWFSMIIHLLYMLILLYNTTQSKRSLESITK